MITDLLKTVDDFVWGVPLIILICFFTSPDSYIF